MVERKQEMKINEEEKAIRNVFWGKLKLDHFLLSPEHFPNPAVWCIVNYSPHFSR
jgi:hypothetical protein